MSVTITIQHAVKRYGANTVIADLSLAIRNGEFFTLLGPSGCGKTTLLRMIAGFNSIEGGDFFFNERRINDLDPAKRNIGMVFQNYAIFPNMTVRKNVEFGLKNRKFPAEEIRERADKYLRIVHVEMLADRMPERLSGGQQQRVALARALCINPDVLKELGVTVEGYADLLNPKLKGKIIIAAPDASSSGYRQLQTVLAVMGDTFDDQKGWDYIARLIPLCYSTNSSKDVFNLVNEGEYAVGLSYESTPAGIIAQGGATMRLVYMKEGNTAMPGGAAIVKNAPNLVAAQAMMDLLASKEFQDRRADLAGRGTNRNCKASDLPANNTLGLKDLDYGYLAANKSKLMDHFNDLWSSLHK